MIIVVVVVYIVIDVEFPCNHFFSLAEIYTKYHESIHIVHRISKTVMVVLIQGDDETANVTYLDVSEGSFVIRGRTRATFNHKTVNKLGVTWGRRIKQRDLKSCDDTKFVRILTNCDQH